MRARDHLALIVHRAAPVARPTPRCIQSTRPPTDPPQEVLAPGPSGTCGFPFTSVFGCGVQQGTVVCPAPLVPPLVGAAVGGHAVLAAQASVNAATGITYVADTAFTAGASRGRR